MKQAQKDEIERIGKLLRPVFKSMKAKKVYLFGSLSRGTQTKRSDVDLMIIAETDKRFFERYDDYESVQRILSDCSVDMLIYTPNELAKIAHRIFIKQILEEGEVLYEC